MSTAELFCGFVDNLKIQNAEVISVRYGELTATLNKKFRDTESKTDNTLQVGSFGRKTGHERCHFKPRPINQGTG